MPEVRDTVDFRRVRDLTRRRLDIGVAESWASELTSMLRAPGGTRAFRPWQGCALVEICENRGAFLGLPVGFGKTDITFVLPTLLGSLRPLLIVPGAGLRDKTQHEFGLLRSQWREPRNMPRVVAWQELTTDAQAKFFTAMCPDLVMIDEGDEGANPDASWTRRIDRHILAHPSTVVVILTGTPGRKSIMDYWHLLGWALRERAPIPMSRTEAKQWALALDESKGRDPYFWKPGPLGADQDSARDWYRTRLAETPGVMLLDGDSCDAPLTVRIRIAREDPKLDEAFRYFLTTLETPDGNPVSDPLSRWRMDGQLSSGLWLRWNPQPPVEWREARKAVAKFVRHTIASSMGWKHPLDTELQVLKRYREHPIVARWLAVRGTFKPKTEAVWVSGSVIESVHDWLCESPEPGIVWTGCVEFATALAHALRLSYYGREGRDQYGRQLHVADPTRSLIASWHACKRGYNLQAWTRQLYVMPPPSAKWWEQSLGRSHRAGQTRPVVADILATSGGTLDLFEKVLSEARFVESTLGMTQKILRAEIVRAVPRVTQANHYRWAQASGPAAHAMVRNIVVPGLTT